MTKRDKYFTEISDEQLVDLLHPHYCPQIFDPTVECRVMKKCRDCWLEFLRTPIPEEASCDGCIYNYEHWDGAEFKDTCLIDNCVVVRPPAYCKNRKPR